MGDEWQTLTLSQAGVELIDCVHKTPKDARVGYPYIGIPQMKKGQIDFNANPRRITYDDFLVWTKKARPQQGDIVLSRRCNPGETAYVPPNVEFALGQNLVLLRADGSNVYPAFLRWLVRGPEWWGQVAKFINVGAVFDSLRCADVPKFELKIPPLDEQRAIAHILGTLDDKIELNRKMNQTLEAMARAIFKSWFVDFDPVHAKAEGRDTGLPEEIADLFPDGFDDSYVGEIPRGWNVKPIGEAVRCVGGSTPSTKIPEYWEGGTNPFVTPKDMSSLNSPIIVDTSRHITDAGVNKISSGKLPTGTVLLSSRAPIGYLAINEVPVSVNQGVIAMICNQILPNAYVLHWVEANMEAVKNNAGGTTFAEISKRSFRPIPALIPSEAVLEVYTQQTEPLHDKIVLNIHESNTLSSLRDTLLPKLISGDLRVPDAENFIKGVA